MADGVAADEIHGVRGFADGLVQIQENFGGGARPVVELPARDGQFVLHLRAPAAQGIIGAIVVFYHFESPMTVKTDDLPYPMQVFGNGRVEITFFGFLITRASNDVCRFVYFSRQQRTGPEAGTHSELFYFGSHGSHVAEFGVALIEIDIFPAIIDNREWAIVRIRYQFRHHAGAFEDEIAGVVPIGKIPVVDAVHGSLRQPRVVAHELAEAVVGLEWRFAGGALGRDDLGGFQGAVTKSYADAAGVGIQDEGKPVGSRLPAAKRARARFDAEGMGLAAIVHEHIPGSTAVQRVIYGGGGH